MRNLLYLLAFVLFITSCEKDNDNGDEKEDPKTPLSEDVLAQYLPDAITGFPDMTEIFTGTLSSVENGLVYAYREYRMQDESSKFIMLEISDYAGAPNAFAGQIGIINNWTTANPANTSTDITISGFSGKVLNETDNSVTIKLILVDRFIITATYTVYGGGPGTETLKTVLSGMNLVQLSEHE